MALDNLKEHLMTAVATSAVLGSGGALLSHGVALARHDERISRIEKLDERMTQLDERLVQTQIALAKLGTKPTIAPVTVDVSGRE